MEKTAVDSIFEILGITKTHSEVKMEQIPIAKEFFRLKMFPSGEISENHFDLFVFTNSDLKDHIEYAVEFAKLHVKAALEAAAENATSSIDIDENTHVEGNVWSEVDKDSIRNAYSEELIK